MEIENTEWIKVCYDENVIEYDEYSDHQDDSNVEVDVEIHSDGLVEFAQSNDSSNSLITDTDLHDYRLNEEVCLSTNTLNGEHNSVNIKNDENEVELVDHYHIPQRFVSNPSNEKRLQLQRSMKALRLKSFIQRENNRFKRRLLNCRICGTHSRFLSMQISVLQAEKQKLMEETSILRLTKEKLLNEMTSLQPTN